MTDQPLPLDDDAEPDRGRSIPADFIWDPKRQCWYPPGEPAAEFTEERWLRESEELYRQAEPYEDPEDDLQADPEERLAATRQNAPATRKSKRSKSKPSNNKLLWDDLDEAPAPSAPESDDSAESE